MTKRAIIYGRVSTDDQAEHGYSLPSQFEAMRRYAEQHGLTVPSPEYEIQDDYTGAKLQRPGLDRARRMLDDHEAEAIIVYSPDRLTRNLAHSLILREEWHRAEIELHYCNRGKSENTPESRMTENIEAVFGDYWRAKIIESSARGRRAKAASGKWPCDGHAAYGYRKVGKAREAHLEIDEAEAAVVRRMFRLYAGLDGAPVNIQAIAAVLTAEGVPPPNWGGGRKHPGMGWHRQTVRKILSKTAYIGELQYAGHIIHAPELAIVDPGLFAAAGKRREQSKAASSILSKYQYLLAGHIRCGCELGMSGTAQQRGRWLYYGCNSALNRRHMRQCVEKLVKAEIVDAIVWRWLVDLLSDEVQLEQGLRDMAARQATDSEASRARLGLVSDLLTEAERKIKRLAAAFGDEKDETIAAALQAQLKQAGRERTALVSERDSLGATVTAGETTEADRETIRRLATAVRTRLIDPTFEQRRQLLNLVDVRVELEWQEGERGVRAICGLTLGEPNQTQSKTQNETPDLAPIGKWLPMTGVCGMSSSTTTTSRRLTTSWPCCGPSSTCPARTPPASPCAPTSPARPTS